MTHTSTDPITLEAFLPAELLMDAQRAQRRRSHRAVIRIFTPQPTRAIIISSLHYFISSLHSRMK